MSSRNGPVGDTSYWHGKPPPLSPNEHEIAQYVRLIGGRRPVCLFGMTSQLVPLCDLAVDLDPIPCSAPVLRSDWGEVSGISPEVVIGDGVLNLTGIGLVDKIAGYSRSLVCRVFLKKFDWMRYATHFPTEFSGASEVVITQEDIAMVRWDF